ncbi:MAG: glycosyltransferase family 2 protein [Peptostreptococcaceae bacterium]|jgi:glycosyltransferase involved in cell wall biosynthesis|nr:glycosyltransferase family 2 protein [Peptostreptococcaceae bacterium]
MFVSIIMPAFNEGSRILDTINYLSDIKLIDEIIVVDDGSSDDTYFKVKDLDKVKAIKLDVNKGKGNAVNIGIQNISNESEIVVFLDADLKESSKDAYKLIVPIIENQADVTIAQFPRAKTKGGFGFVKNLAKNGVKYFTNKELTSVLSGQRGFKREVINRFVEIPSGYGMEVGMTIDILNMGYEIKEIPVNMTHRETKRDLKGFIHRGRQFYHILKVLIAYYFKKDKGCNKC